MLSPGGVIEFAQFLWRHAHFKNQPEDFSRSIFRPTPIEVGYLYIHVSVHATVEHLAYAKLDYDL